LSTTANCGAETNEHYLDIFWLSAEMVMRVEMKLSEKRMTLNLVIGMECNGSSNK